MPDKFDPYRESLVMETETIWPEGYAHLDAARQQKISLAAHSDAENATQIDYIRLHTGFCRKITLTDEEIRRLAGKR